MKAAAFILLIVFCNVECGRKYVPINKNANLDFINMEGGGVKIQPMQPKPAAPISTPTTKAPTIKPVAPQSPTPAPKPVQTPTQPKPVQSPTPPKPVPQSVPVTPAPAVKPITTPGPGSVMSLVNFYDSQGKGSVIRPYSYSQAVKQGKTNA